MNVLLNENSKEITLEAKKEALRRFLQERSSRRAVYPLSSSQQRLWLLRLMNRSSYQYNIPVLIRVRGELDIAVFKRCLEALAVRHECLRTRFELKDGSPVQTFHAGMELDVSSQDLSDESETEGQEAQFVEFFRTPIDVETGPCWRCRVVRTQRDSFLIGLAFHHIIADGWSLSVFWRELVALYENNGDALCLKEAPTCYADFVEAEEKWLGGESALEMGRYWAERLKGVPSLLELPWDRPREPVASFAGRRIELSLDAEVTRSLEDLARASNCTLFSLLITAYRILLYRYSGQDDFCIGFPVANRESSRFGQSFGLFINTLVHRSKLDEGQSFTETLRRANREIRSDIAQQALPFARLLESAKTDRNPSFNPLFQAMFIMQNAAKQKERVGTLEMTLDEMDIGVAKFDLTLEANQVDGALRLIFEYNAHLFDESTIQRMGDSYRTILGSVQSAPDTRVRDLSWVGDSETRSVLREWNRTEKPFPSSQRFETSFAQNAKAAPSSPAVACALFEQPLSYGELDRLSNKFARFLIERGLKPGDRVGIFLQRSTRMIVTILGAFKAGASYVPLDPSFPIDRLRLMMMDAELSHLAIESSLPIASDVYNGLDAKQIDWDREAKAIESQSDEALDLALDSNAVAYTIYTSGSTGKPKGVQIQHRALINFLDSMAREPGLSSSDRLLSVTTLSFDISILELLLPLYVGAQVVVAARDVALDGRKLANALEAGAITCMQATPATWRLLVDSGWKGKSDLKMLCGGEALPHDLAMRLVRRGRELWNMYGPTETTIWSSVLRIYEGDTEILIGPPIANTQFYVLDRNLQPLPRGVVGELYIGGEGLSLGYWKRPDLTNAAFINAPENWGEGNRIYKVGDLVKLRNGGRLEFVGRADFQVKVRGFRIELGDIETSLSKIDSVDQSICSVREDRPGDQRIVAYVIIQAGARFDEASVRSILKDTLPHYMIPSSFVVLSEFPQTPNGKIDRKRLPKPRNLAESSPASSLPPSVGGLYAKVSDAFKETLHIDKVGLDDSFFDLGGHSLLLTNLQTKLEASIGRSLEIMDLFRFPTVRGLVQHIGQGDIEGRGGEAATTGTARSGGNAEPIAIVGMSCRFPGATNVDAFWRLLEEGREGIADISEEQAAAAGVDPSLFENPKYVRRFGILENAKLFDADFFGYRPREAEIMDPQQRVFLEVCHEGLEDALCDSQRYPGSIGVFAGVGISSYANSQMDASDPNRLSENYQVMIGNDKDFLATRVAYRLNLRGPAISVQTACSTSLVAVHLACESLRKGDSDMALAGGSSIRFPQDIGYVYEEGMILSPDGHCRAFDEKAHGTVGGSGAGVVVLKRLSDARKDGDRVYAVIKGSSVNNDGSQKIGYTAPSLEGQSKAISEALVASGVDPASIGYIEAHGTGTPLGDPIEFSALSKSYGRVSTRENECAIGSVKTNIGHLDTAAGVAGLIKAALAVKNARIPATLWFEKGNPKLNLDESRFFVNSQLREWNATEGPRRAGVSSFGIGGTNVHLILEQADHDESQVVVEESSEVFDQSLLCVSAKSENALKAQCRNLAEFLEQGSDLNLRDVAYSLNVGRGAFAHRTSFVCSDRSEAIAVLKAGADAGSVDAGESSGKVVFMFSGQGSQYPNMARGLYENALLFRETVDRCFAAIAAEFEIDPRQIVFPRESDAMSSAESLEQTCVAQPVLFVFEYALARYWMSMGVHPSAMIGHSVGEYVCACLSGALREEDALRLISARGRMMQSMPVGSMLAISESPLFVAEFAASHDLDLASVNSPRTSVVSGTREQIKHALQVLEAKDIPHRELHTSHAFHSRTMDGMLGEFEKLVSEITFSQTTIPYISNLTGDWITAEQIADPAYWREHLRSTVRFAEGIEKLIEFEPSALLEVGPGSALKTFAKHQAVGKSIAIEASLPHPKDATDCRVYIMNTLGRLWENGANVDWKAFHEGSRREKVALPYYPFERMQFSIDTDDSSVSVQKNVSRRQPIDRWMYAPVWRRSARAVRPPSTEYKRGLVLVFDDAYGFLGTVSERLASKGKRIVNVSIGSEFGETESGYRIRPGSAEDYDTLFKSIGSNGKEAIEQILHGWNVTAEEERGSDEELSFVSLLRLAQAMGKYASKNPIDLRVFANRMHRVIGDEVIDPMKSLLVGPVRVIPQELDGVACQCLDVQPVNAEEAKSGRLADMIMQELASPAVDRTVAFRGGYRWVRDFELLEGGYSAVGESDFQSTRLKEGGVYWIVGGLGGMGYVLAHHLAAERGAKLLITGRADLPAASEWESISRQPTREGQSAGKLLALTEAGCELIYRQADLSDAGSLDDARDAVLREFGRLDGVIHAGGVAGDGLILGKTDEAALKTLNPKVRGTLALSDCLKQIDIDFLLLCSSVTAENGGIGQVDYCSANAFMDAYAQSQDNGSDLPRVISAQWDAWSESGMAARIVRNAKSAQLLETSHSLVGQEIHSSESARVFASRLHASRDWVLSEHWILGRPTVPGTTFLEMARASVSELSNESDLCLSDVYFMSPLSAEGDEEVEIRTVLQTVGGKRRFTVLSRTESVEVGFWRQHLTLDIASEAKRDETNQIDIESLKRRCSSEKVDDVSQLATMGRIVGKQEGQTHSNAVEFGPRWRNLTSAWLGKGEGLARLELAAAYKEDLDTFSLHPALLDCATAFLRLIRQEGVFLPLSYERIVIKGDLPAVVYSHAVEVQKAQSDKGTASFDVRIYDEYGYMLVDITCFTLREIDEASLASSAKRTILTSLDLESPKGSASEFQKEIARKGIKDAEGILIFNRILDSGNSQVLVSTHDYPLRRGQFDALKLGNELAIGASRRSQTRHARPKLKTPFVAPAGEIELALAELWESLLGIQGMGALDDAFELGSDSLLLVQFHKELTSRFETDLSVVDLYKYTTIKELAKRLDKGAPSDIENSASIEKAAGRASKAKDARSRRKERAQRLRR